MSAPQTIADVEALLCDGTMTAASARMFAADVAALVVPAAHAALADEAISLARKLASVPSNETRVEARSLRQRLLLTITQSAAPTDVMALWAAMDACNPDASAHGAARATLAAATRSHAVKEHLLDVARLATLLDNQRKG